ncbi:MAG: hypothetical protein AB1467_02530 [Candidatus Diapherotrites archaeon]
MDKRFSYKHRKKGNVVRPIIPIKVAGKGFRPEWLIGQGRIDLGRRKWKNQRIRLGLKRRSFDPKERIIISRGRRITTTRRLLGHMERIERIQAEIAEANRKHFFEKFDLTVDDLKTRKNKIPNFSLNDAIEESKKCIGLSEKALIVAKAKNDKILKRDAKIRLRQAKKALKHAMKILNQRKGQAKKAG